MADNNRDNDVWTDVERAALFAAMYGMGVERMRDVVNGVGVTAQQAANAMRSARGQLLGGTSVRTGRHNMGRSPMQEAIAGLHSEITVRANPDAELEVTLPAHGRVHSLQRWNSRRNRNAK